MFKKRYLTIAMASMSFFAQSGTHSFDTRSTGMGGIGVSSADHLTAAFHNPALVAKFKDDDDIGILLPYVGVQVQDPDELVDQLDDFSDLYDDFENSLNMINNSQDIINAQTNAQGIVDSLTEMQGDKGYIQAGIGGAISIPNSLLSFSVYSKIYADGFIVADISDEDLNPHSYDDNYELQSQAIVLGTSIVEVGVAIAKSFELETGTLYVGFTPKYQNITTINYAVSIDNYDFDDLDDDRYQNDDGNINVDIGVAYDMGEGFVFGFVAKNLIEQSYDTVLSDANIQATYVMNPVYTVSASFNHSLFTIGIDVDLNETERYEDFTGLNTGDAQSAKDNIQMAGIGAEFNAWDWAQLRLGYQSDIANTLEDQFTAGIGFSPFGVLHIDLAAMYSGDEQFGASLQTALTF